MSTFPSTTSGGFCCKVFVTQVLSVDCARDTYLSRLGRVLVPVILRLSEGIPFERTGDILPVFLVVSQMSSCDGLLEARLRVSVDSGFGSVGSSDLSSLFAFSNSAEMSVTLRFVSDCDDLGVVTSWVCDT